jgi:hypothetical protein
MTIAVPILAGIVLAACVTTAQTPSAGGILSFTATTENVAGAPDTIRINLLRWSSDAERDQLLSAWNMAGTSARRRSSGRGAEPGAVNQAPDPAADDGDASAAFSAPKGGSGHARADGPPATPEGALAAAIKKAHTVGYLWSSEIAGYALRYAGKTSEPDGVERIILITDRRLGTTNDRWKPIGPGIPTTYDFSVIELRVNSKGEGEGKISLIAKVAPDSAAKVVALEDYDASPVVLKNLKRRTVDGQ